ncbi:hypothetical protein BDR03DRAFT_415988 [Suillus americanus]|nr:hypothetical protein BDR03DRAFT_415988 [Suillus americanus]
MRCWFLLCFSIPRSLQRSKKSLYTNTTLSMIYYFISVSSSFFASTLGGRQHPSERTMAQSLQKQEYTDDLGVEEVMGFVLGVMSKMMDSTILESEKRKLLFLSYLDTALIDLYSTVEFVFLTYDEAAKAPKDKIYKPACSASGARSYQMGQNGTVENGNLGHSLHIAGRR